MYYSSETQQIASEPVLVGVADPNAALVEWSPIGQYDSPIGIWHTVAFVGFTAGTIGGAYHGYKRARENKILVALWYGFVGGIFWPLVIPIMFAQGFAKPKGQ